MNLKQLRIKKGLTVEDVFFRLRNAGVNLSISTINRWERDQNAIRLTLLEDIAKAYGITVDEIINS